MGTDKNTDGRQPAWVLILVAIIGVVGPAMVCGVPVVIRLLDICCPAPAVMSTPTLLSSSQNSQQETPQIQHPTEQTPQFDGQCAAVPVNLQDNAEVQLDPSRWYLIEDYDNQASPPVHIFRTQMGTITVNANAFRGLRAWECPNEAAAVSQAWLNAVGYKQGNPSHKVFGPDGQEVK